MLRFLAVTLIACSAPAATNPPPLTPPSKSIGEQAGLARGPDQPVAQQHQARAKVVVKSSGAASRQPERPRVLAKLLADRRGRIQLAREYARVGLTITEVVSGTLDDPDYAKRPTGTNHLSVVLLDEAAFAASTGLDGFEGTWTLTKTADGTLIVSSIADTPWNKDKVATRDAVIADTRRLLHAASPDERVRGIDGFEAHAFYELVPDLIELLDDDRSTQQQPPGRGRGARKVRTAAFEMLVRLMTVFGDDRMPLESDRAKWTALWSAILVPDLAPRKRIIGTPIEIAQLSQPQSSPELAPFDGGFAVGLGRLDQPVDGHTEGLALTKAAFSGFSWLSSQAGESLDVARGPNGSVAVLHVSGNRWKLAMPALPTIELAIAASHAAIAASAKGYVIAFIQGDTEAAVHLVQLDPTGKRVGQPVKLRLPTAAQGGYHHGVFPLALAQRPGGWFVVVETDAGTVLITLDDAFKQIATLDVPPSERGIPQVKLAVGKDRALLAWTEQQRGRAAKVGTLVVDLAGRAIGTKQTVGFDVDTVARPIVLDDGGFAIAWIAGEQEVHVGRWSPQGALLGSAIVQPHGASSQTLALARDGKGLLVGFEDDTRYPTSLRARRIEAAEIGP